MSRLTEKQSTNSRNEWMRVWAIPIVIVLIGFFIAWAGVEPPPPKTIRLASGGTGGSYHAFALQYAEVLAESDFELEIIETAGSVENLELLRRGEVDAAFVQGGTAQLPEDGEALLGLASVFFEPVWFFQRQEGAVLQLRDLAGKRLLVGGEGSGTRAMANRLLQANGLDATSVELLPRLRRRCGTPTPGRRSRRRFLRHLGEVGLPERSPGLGRGHVDELRAPTGLLQPLPFSLPVEARRGRHRSGDEPAPRRS